MSTFKNPELRNWSTRLTMGAFLLVSGTGMLMFFEQESLGIITVVHQWTSLLLVFGVINHVAANFKPFKKHINSVWGKSSIVVFTLIFVASLNSWGLITGPQLERPIEQALGDAPLSLLALVTKTDIDVLLSELNENGINATADQSIRDLVLQLGIDENELLGIIFLK